MRLFDLHCDTLYECVKTRQSIEKNALDLDLERGKNYRPWIQVFAAWTPDGLRGAAAYRAAKEVLSVKADRLRILQKGEKLDDVAAPAGIAETVNCIGILALEGGSPVAGGLETIDEFAGLGVKIITITWNGDNELGHGCRSPDRSGLTPYGKKAAARMIADGILPDVSHLNEAGFWDVAALTPGQFIASHSVSMAVHSHPRNLTDGQFLEIKRHGGAVGLNLCESQLGEQSFDCFEKHLDHFLALGGEDTLGLGFDLDGTPLPAEWGGIAAAGLLREHLLRKNYPESLLEKLFFGNSYNLFARL